MRNDYKMMMMMGCENERAVDDNQLIMINKLSSTDGLNQSIVIYRINTVFPF